MTKQELGHRVRVLRTMQNLKQKELAQRADISCATIVAIERGHYSQHSETIERLEAAFGCNLEVELFTIEQPLHELTALLAQRGLIAHFSQVSGMITSIRVTEMETGLPINPPS